MGFQAVVQLLGVLGGLISAVLLFVRFLRKRVAGTSVNPSVFSAHAVFHTRAPVSDSVDVDIACKRGN